MRKILFRKPLYPGVLPFLILVTLVLLFLHKMAFSNLILARGDTFLYFYPYWQAAAAALREARVPLWNPNIFMGTPLLANSQVGFFYPLNWPFWWFMDTPYAVNASILLHLFIAGSGTYLAARKVMAVDCSSATVAAVAFALGGYLTAQVEHINQIQGLSWLPWFLLVIGSSKPTSRRSWLSSVLAIAALFSFQLLAGHTQTAFITAVALVIWIFAQNVSEYVTDVQELQQKRVKLRRFVLSFLIVISSGLLALMLVAIQIVPTLELTRLSGRQGGLPSNEVLSFSLHPLLITRALLPAYGQSLFSEYVAFLPLTILALAIVGAWQWRNRAGVFAALALTLVGLLFALGLYNPLNWLLAQLPGFSYFRAPARWLVLYALGMSLLAGVGWQLISEMIRARRIEGGRLPDRDKLRRLIVQPLLFFLIIVLLLMAWGFLARLLIEIIPIGSEAPFEAPSGLTVLGWVLELFLLLTVLLFVFNSRSGKHDRLLGILLAGAIIVLFAASRTLPYNNLTAPEAFFDHRPPISRMLASPNEVDDRFLSLSDIFFDPGDQVEIDTIYGDQLPTKAQYDYTIAIKQKEVVAPNLSVAYGLSSVDGFDGGVLPLRSYSELMKLILPEGVETKDGRLREYLDRVPDGRWLDLFNARFLITDKVGDIWRDGVFFDRQHTVRLREGESVSVGYLPEFEGTELRLLASDRPELVRIITAGGESQNIVPESMGQDLFRVRFPAPAFLREVIVNSCAGSTDCEVQALTLLDERDNTFQALVPGNYRMIHSGDVKIYENLDVMQRAFVVYDWQLVPDSETVINTMLSPDFNARKTAVLVAADSELPKAKHDIDEYNEARVEITHYSPEKVVLETQSEADGLLMLTDANYPGWNAKIDKQPTTIYESNGLFRSVYLPAGQHEVVFALDSKSYAIGKAVTIVALSVTALLLAYIAFSREKVDL